MHHSPETKERVQELKEQGSTNREIQEQIFEELSINVSLGSISRRTQHIQAKIDDTHKKIKALSDSIEDNDDYDVNHEDELLYVYSSKTNKYGEKEKIRFEIPFDIVNRIQRKYPKSGSSWSQQKIIHHNWGTDKSPLYLDSKARKALKNAMDINKDSGINNPVFLKILEDKYGEEAMIEYIEENAMSTERQRHIDIERKKIARVKERLYKEALKKVTVREEQLKMLQQAIGKYKPRTIDFDIEKPKNKQKAYIVLSDIHYGRTSDVVEERLGKILGQIESMEEGHITLLNLGDNMESVILGGMHDSQVLEMDVIGSEQFQGIIRLMEEFVIAIYKMGKTVDIHGLTHSNHDRLTKNFRGDQERLLGKVFFLMLEKGLQNLDTQVNMYRDKIGTFNDGHLRFIMHHGDGKFNKAKPERILYGDQGIKDTDYKVNRFKPGKHHIVVSGHWHTRYLESGPGRTRAMTPSPNDPDSYAIQDYMGAEDPGYLIIHPTEQSAEFLFKTFN